MLCMVSEHFFRFILGKEHVPISNSGSCTSNNSLKYYLSAVF